MEAKNIIYSKANIDNNFPGKNLFMKNKLKPFVTSHGLLQYICN